MSHNEIVRTEFARQAVTFAASATLASAEITDAIADALGPMHGARVLDLACGPGLLMDALRRTGGLPVGIDLTADTLRLARQRQAGMGGESGTGAFVCGLAERLPFARGAFAGAAVRLALHHVERPRDVLGALRDVVTPGGRIVVLDVLTSADAGTAALHNAIERLRDPSHAAFVSETEQERQISDAGLALERVACWERPRRFSEWAAIINEPQRMRALETVLRALARAGTTAGIGLREEAGNAAGDTPGELCFTYRFGLFVATAP